MNLLFKLCIVLLVGLAGGKVARLFKLPDVSGYLMAGLFLGPSFFKYISAVDIGSFSIISEFALAIIAFSIGSEFILKDMLKLGKKIMIITLAEVVGAVAVVFCVMFFIFNQPFAFSIVIASMSAATAPAATLMVMKQYSSRGPLSKTILPVVALDDVFGIMAFGLAIAVAKLSTQAQNMSLVKMLIAPVIEIFGSMLLGLLLGFLLSLIAKKSKGRDELQVFSLAAIGVSTGLSALLGFSPLLTCIMMGAVLVNMLKTSKRVFDSVNDFASPVYVVFFTLAGASLNLSIFATVGLMGLGYILARAGGKIFGAYVGAKSVQASKTVTRYLGFALLPQGGISIGLIVLVRQQLPEHAVAISSIIMFSVLVYEITGPVFAKIALQKAGEINGLGNESAVKAEKHSKVALIEPQHSSLERSE